MPRPSKTPNAAKPAVAGPAAKATPAATVAPPRAAGGPSLRQLAHELNSLLDGSMRCVGLARASLQQGGANAPGASIDDGLGKAHAAMKHMAALLERAMRQAEADGSSAGAMAMFDARQSLRQTCDELDGLLKPHAQAANATIRFDVAADCAELPAATLGPVLMNGLRNALQACEAVDHAAPARVAALLSQHKDSLIIRISGPTASKAEGHRLGLALSSQIIDELGGELGLTTGEGLTTLRVSVPLASLRRHA